MTTCAYCRREYDQPPAECVGCGAPVPQAPRVSIFDQCAGLMSGMAGDGDDPANWAINAALEYRDLLQRGEIKRITPRHMAAAQYLGDPIFCGPNAYGRMSVVDMDARILGNRRML